MRDYGKRISKNEFSRIRYNPSRSGVRWKTVSATNSRLGAPKWKKVSELKPARNPEMIIDSRASKHVVSDINLFTSLEQIESTEIELAYGMIVTCYGKRSIVVRTRYD